MPAPDRCDAVRYGVLAPLDMIPWNSGAVDDDGVTVTDTQTGEARLVVSFRNIVDAIGGSVGELGDRVDGGRMVSM